MAALPYMQFYFADYLADTAHLTTVEHGAYLLLIATYWQSGKPLPNDDRRLAKIAGMSAKEWSRVKATIAEFFIITGGEWRHKRIEKELLKVASKSEKSRAAGRASAERRSNARSTSVQRASNHTDTDTDTDIDTDYYPAGISEGVIGGEIAREAEATPFDVIRGGRA